MRTAVALVLTLAALSGIGCGGSDEVATSEAPSAAGEYVPPSAAESRATRRAFEQKTRDEARRKRERAQAKEQAKQERLRRFLAEEKRRPRVDDGSDGDIRAPQTDQEVLEACARAQADYETCFKASYREGYRLSEEARESMKDGTP